MPTYDYKCRECGHTFEEFQSISADPLVQCPQCGKNSLKRGLGGGAGMIFKGQGFYLTDYKKGGNPPGTSAKKDQSSPKKDAAEPAAKPDSDSAKTRSDSKKDSSGS